MAISKKTKTLYVCDHCGNEYLQWQGKCDACGEWNSLKQLAGVSLGTIGRETTGSGGENWRPVPITDAVIKEEERLPSGIEELDRVLGGGLVRGSLVLLSGDPGVGKSTLLLQMAGKLAARNETVLYVSGEESEAQVRGRAARVGALVDNLLITPVTDVNLLSTLAQSVAPKVLIIDSIQTLIHPDYPSSPGSMVQLRESSLVLQHLAKRFGVTVLIIGHITKEGYIAGPKLLEHIVDTVLTFDAKSDRAYRLLRVEKNRYGDTAEVGVFSLGVAGLESVADPSRYFLSERQVAPGSVLTVVMEGARPLVLEIQALANKSVFGYPKRTASGWDPNRLQLILAILERHAGVSLAEHDVYVNVVGGLKVREPAADLAVAAAVVSSLKNQSLPENLCLYGEVGLTGEVRKVFWHDRRAEVVQRLGYSTLPFTASLKEVLRSQNLI